jgi:DNA repair protein RadB
MESKKISTGTKILDEFLDGGFEKDTISLIYGPGGSGKTNLCILTANSIVEKKKKVIYVDTESNFSVNRLKQINKLYKNILDNIFFLKPTNFSDQRISIRKIRDMIQSQIGLIIIDSISALYRLEMSKHIDVYDITKELSLQLQYLLEITRKNNIPIIVTSQVYDNMNKKGSVNFIGGDILRNASKCIIELENGQRGKRRASIIKHRSIEEGKSTSFIITEKGFDPIKL